MDPSNAQEHQAMATHSLEDMLTCPKPHQERRLRPPQEQALKCPRCDSNNTKFCYYNNYSLSQPRYFCKGCRRYWTQGGTLRNVPVGGGCRKNKKPSSSKRTQDQAIITTNSNPLHPTLPPLTYESNDLTLSFTRDIFHKQPTRQLGLGFDHDHETSILGDINTTHRDILGNPNTTTTNTTPSFLDALRSGFLDTQSGLHNFYYGNAGGGEVLPYEELSGATTTTTATTITTTKQEFCKDGDEENRMFCNFPWKINGEGDLGGVGSGRECWNNGLGSSWHGLLNSRMM